MKIVIKKYKNETSFQWDRYNNIEPKYEIINKQLHDVSDAWVLGAVLPGNKIHLSNGIDLKIFNVVTDLEKEEVLISCFSI